VSERLKALAEFVGVMTIFAAVILTSVQRVEEMSKPAD